MLKEKWNRARAGEPKTPIIVEKIESNTQIMTKSKGLSFMLLQYLAIFIALFLAGKASIFNIRPFAIGLYLALIYWGLNLGACSSLFVLSSLMCDLSFISLVASLFASSIMLVVRLIEHRTKRKIGLGLIIIPSLLSQVAYVYFNLSSGESGVHVLLSLFFSMLFLYSNICFFRPVIQNNFKYRFLDYEIICGCIFLIILALGVSSVSAFGFPLISAVSLFLICIFAYLGGTKASLVIGICLGTSSALFDYNITMMACLPFVSILVAIFISSNRFLAAAAGVIGYSMFVFYFNLLEVDSLVFIGGLGAGGLIFCLIPKSVLEKGRNFFSGSFTRTALRYVVNHNRRELGNALFKVSDIFYEMSGLMSGLRNEISDKNVEILYNRIVDDFCGECPKKAICGGNKDMRDAIEDVIKTSVKKGRASVIDLPTIVTDSCLKIAQLITFASEISTQYNRHIKTMENENAAKRIVSEQLLGVSSILKDMGIKEASPLSYDLLKERAIMEELTYRNVICSEALLTLSERGGRVTLIVLTESVDKQIIEKSLSKVLGQGYNVTEIEESTISGFSVVYLESSPKFDIVFGYAACPKSSGESSGDTHSFIKIHNNKFMMALCDGMGSGEKARRFSDATISLIENFYKAGFEHSLVLENVNKFLSLSSEETFSAVDVCVVDLETAEVDVIKIGSPASYIKSNDSVLKVDGCALPIGMLEEMRPSVCHQKLTGGDMVVLTTDGISDSYSGDELASLINHLAGKNPQTLCAKIAETTLEKNKPKDDMTVAAFRIFKRVS